MNPSPEFLILALIVLGQFIIIWVLSRRLAEARRSQNPPPPPGGHSQQRP